MDASRLNALDTETLTKLRDSIQIIIDSRLDTAPRVGRTATFTDNNGIIRKAVIVKVNTKTVSCEETHESAKPGSKWRVGKGELRVDPIERKGAPLPSLPRLREPVSTAGSGSW